MTKVNEIKIGQKVKFNNTTVICQNHKNGKMIVSKQENSPCTMSISHFSSDYEDLQNRVKLV